MNYRLVLRLLGIIAILIGGAMIFSLPWAHPALGHRPDLKLTAEFEMQGFIALILSTAISLGVGGGLIWVGGKAQGTLYRKEAMAAVGFSWIMATVLGSLPFLLSGCERAPGVPMSVVDALFESQSGFSTTGATVISDLETMGVPHCILFWRSSTHFLGGLGIVVLFVAILGMGSSGKALMRAEITGPTKDGAHTRMQQSAWLFAGIYVALNIVMALILMFAGLTLFDALCHSFGTMATGGFSTYNASVKHFDSATIDYVIIVFMVLAGANFTLLAFSLLRGPAILTSDTEFRVYVGIILVATLAIIAFGIPHGDFSGDSTVETAANAMRYSLFQVVSILTTTGFGTSDFDQWTESSRILLLVLMFIGGCAGSTGGGMKVIRHILMFKILRVEIEQAYRPTLVRTLRLAGTTLDDPKLRQKILVYFAIILTLFIGGWLFVATFERDAVWGADQSNKLIDSASAVAATLNNIGPGFGVVGPTQHYTAFSWYSKLLFVWLMMIGRLEIYSVLVLLLPGFWRNR